MSTPETNLIPLASGLGVVAWLADRREVLGVVGAVEGLGHDVVDPGASVLAALIASVVVTLEHVLTDARPCTTTSALACPLPCLERCTYVAVLHRRMHELLLA